ncbi:MAG: homoserine dehydrogenase [Vicinamibacterales bacterium]
MSKVEESGLAGVPVGTRGGAREGARRGGPIRRVRVGLLGAGRVGSAVAVQARRRAGDLEAVGLAVDVVAALVRDRARPRGVDLPVDALVEDADAVFAAAPDVLVEVLGGEEPARTIVASAIARGIPVVTANKTLVARHGAALSAAAARARTALHWEASVIAGVPFIGALRRRPLLARARRIAGILNGTSHFVLGEMARGATIEAALARAVERGYAEPDASGDLSGRDAAEKLAILLRLAGQPAGGPEDLPVLGLEPIAPRDLTAAARLGGVIKPVAVAGGLRAVSQAPSGFEAIGRADDAAGDDGAGRRAGDDAAAAPPDDTGAGTAWVGPAFVVAGHPFARLDGVRNALALTGVDGEVVSFSGPGAGPEVTAATILDDVAEVVRSPVSGWGGRPESIDPSPVPGARRPPRGRWFVHVEGAGRALDVLAFLAARGIPSTRFEPTPAGGATLTWPVGWDEIREGSAALRLAGARVVALPVIEEAWA